MEDIINQIKKSRTIKDSSLKTYITSLKCLINNINGTSKQDLTKEDMKILYDYDRIIKHINKDIDKLTTKKNRLTSILVYLNSETPPKEKLIDKYNTILKDYGNTYLKIMQQQKKSEKQKDNWITYDKLIDIVNTIYNEIKNRDLTKLKDYTNISNKEFDIIQQYIILRTYVEFPIRNDFANMKVMNKDKYEKLSDDEKQQNNYLLILPKGKKNFILNQFKNVKFIGPKVIDIPQKLNRVLTYWLKVNKSGWFLVKANRKDPLTPNLITKYLNRLFKKRVNKKISTSLIRHIVISNVLKDEKTIKEKQKEADFIKNKFLHSKNTADLYYRKVD